MSGFALRIASMADCDAIRTLMNRAIRDLQAGFLTDDQIAASFVAMGLDTQLIEDGTYFTVKAAVRGCLTLRQNALASARCIPVLIMCAGALAKW
jgi:hypothetical protein